MFISQSKSFFLSLGCAISTTIVYYIYDAYRRSIQPSKYMLIAQKMGFIGDDESNGSKINMEEQQEALLKIFHLAGYFNLANLWQDLNRLGNIQNLKEVFQEISSVVKSANADRADPAEFNAKYMRKNLFKSDNLDLQDALDLILYIGQHAFNRKLGQERYEVTSEEWMMTYADEYRESARLLGLIDRKTPSLVEYDECWIAGAARVVLIQRILEYNNYITSRNVQIHGETLILAGEREIWANIDGISPAVYETFLQASENNIDLETISLPSSTDDEATSTCIDEGASYMLKLAALNNIKLNTFQPFIEYNSKDECPVNRFPNRIYANYDSNETLKLTETLMSYDSWKTFSRHNVDKLCIIDTSSYHQTRPNTASTARDATERLVKHILAGDYEDKRTFVILFCSNNPYIERQTLATQRQVNQVLENHGLIEKSYQIRIEGVGCSNQQQLPIVHSELGALITEKWAVANDDLERSLGLKPKREKKDLLFQTRDNHLIVGGQPKIKNNRFSNFVKNWFDLYLT